MGMSEDTWSCLACSAGSRESVPETGKESNSSVCHESPFLTPAGANPAPLTRTWKGTDTILDVCAVESFPAFFFGCKVHFSSCLWLQVGEVSTGTYICSMSSQLFGCLSCLKSSSQLACRERPISKREDGRGGSVCCSPDSSWGQSEVGQQGFSPASCLSRSDEVINGKEEGPVWSAQFQR